MASSRTVTGRRAPRVPRAGALRGTGKQQPNTHRQTLQPLLPSAPAQGAPPTNEGWDYGQ
ncbi:MAG: hypothetical protein QXX32_00675 [Thermofilum sp.]|uniref:hypothetical protein n=1 Tax=Thermofilum sp. TaxID=1961369 RepID=UPI00317A1AF2